MSASAPTTSASTSQPWNCIPLTTTAERTAHLGALPSVLTLDLSRIAFIDCAGLAALLRISVHASYSRTALLLGPISPSVARLIALTGDPFHI
jgi:anti-anti-sigma factor